MSALKLLQFDLSASQCNSRIWSMLNESYRLSAVPSAGAAFAPARMSFAQALMQHAETSPQSRAISGGGPTRSSAPNKTAIGSCTAFRSPWTASTAAAGSASLAVLPTSYTPPVAAQKSPEAGDCPSPSDELKMEVSPLVLFPLSTPHR